MGEKTRPMRASLSHGTAIAAKGGYSISEDDCCKCKEGFQCPEEGRCERQSRRFGEIRLALDNLHH